MSERIFAFLLSLYPRGFREKYFQEAMLLYRDRYRYETGVLRRTRLWCDLVADLATGLPRAWQTFCPVAAVPSESRITNGPSFHLLHSEPLRPAVILVSGVLTLGAVGAFTFVLNIAFRDPIHPRKMSPIESVMHRLNQSAFPEPGYRHLPNDLTAGSIAPLTEEADANKRATTARGDVARPHAGNGIRKRRAQNFPDARRSREAEQPRVMLRSPQENDGGVLPTSNQESAVHPAINTSLSYEQNLAQAGYEDNGPVSHEQALPENTTKPMVRAENEGPGRPTARETYVSLPLAEVQLLLSGDCTTIRASRQLPEQIKNAFATITHTKPFALAESAAGFNATRLIEPGLPERRLMLAGRCQDRWFIEYEHGGTAKSVALMVLRANPDRSVTFVWGRQLKDGATDLGQLRAALSNGAYLDAPYSW
jgi:hypothetical protein